MAADRNWVTCRCQKCDGVFLFDANELGPGETHTQCLHCNAETEVPVPLAPKPAAIAEKPPPPAEAPGSESIQPAIPRALRRRWIPAGLAVGMLILIGCLYVWYEGWKRQHVQITSGEYETIPGSTMYRIYELQEMTPYRVTVHNGAGFAIKNISIKWVFYDKADTALTTCSETFHETMKPGEDKAFRMPAWSLPGETVRSRASVRSVGRVWW